MKKIAAAIIITLTFSTSSESELVKGVVVYDKGCHSRFIVQTNLGFALVEWMGGYSPSSGDIMVGDFDSYGSDAYDITGDTSTSIFIDANMMTRDRVIQRLLDKCPPS